MLILLSDGTQVERTHFLENLQVGDVLFALENQDRCGVLNSLEKFTKNVIEYEVKKVGRKYADLVKRHVKYVFHDVNKMNLQSGVIENKYFSHRNIILFGSREEALAFYENLELRAEFQGYIPKLNKLDIVKIKVLNDILKEMLAED